MTRGEAAAWNRASRLAEEQPDTLFKVWKVPGGFDVTKAGEPDPTRGQYWGAVREYSKPTRAYTIQTGEKQCQATI